MNYCDMDPDALPPCDLKITEALDSRRNTATGLATGGRGASETWELHLFVQGSNDECEIRRRLEPGSVYGLPKTFPGFGPGAEPSGGALQSYPLREFQVSCIGWQLWEVTATYGWDGPVDRDVFRFTLPTQISMSTRGGNAKLSKSVRTMDSYPRKKNPGAFAELPAPDFEGAIEWDGKTINGVNVPVPLTRYSESWIFPRRRIFSPVSTGEQLRQDGGGDGKVSQADWPGRYAVWENYTGCVHGPVHNKDSWDDAEKDKAKNEPALQRGKFRGWEPGSVLLDNVNIRQVGLHHFEVTFDFLVQSPRQGLALPWSVEDYMTTMETVDGWDHIWSYYEIRSATAKTTEATPQEYKVTAPEPKFVYVERIMERRNFGNLDIGVAPFSGMEVGMCTGSAVDLMNGWDLACKRENPR